MSVKSSELIKKATMFLALAQQLTSDTELVVDNKRPEVRHKPLVQPGQPNLQPRRDVGHMADPIFNNPSDSAKSEQLRKYLNTYLSTAKTNLVIDNTPDIKWSNLDSASPTSITLTFVLPNGKSQFNFSQLETMLNGMYPGAFKTWLSSQNIDQAIKGSLNKIKFVLNPPGSYLAEPNSKF